MSKALGTIKTFFKLGYDVHHNEKCVLYLHKKATVNTNEGSYRKWGVQVHSHGKKYLYDNVGNFPKHLTTVGIFKAWREFSTLNFVFFTTTVSFPSPTLLFCYFQGGPW